MIRAGELRERITIQQLTESVNASSGAVSAGWSTWWSVRAKVEALSGTEGSEGDAAVARRSYKVTTRWKTGLTTDMRIVWGDQTLLITSAVADPLRRQWVIECKENLSRD